MSIQIGRQAPRISFDAYVRHENEPLSAHLQNYHGRWVVLLAYPQDRSLVQLHELRAFAEVENEFALENAVVLAASPGSYFDHRLQFESEPLLANINLPVIASSRGLSIALGLTSESSCTFIIDDCGFLRYSSTNTGTPTRVAEDALRALQSLLAEQQGRRSRPRALPNAA